jgi:GNAT superfamily N-acetyltransferase
MVRALTDLRPGQHEAYAAWRQDRPVGIVRWIRTAERPQAAELAVEVVDDEQGRGVGRELVAHAAASAWLVGIRTMLVSVDPHNERVRGWLARRHARALVEDADRFAVPTQQLLESPTADPRGPRDDDRLWIAHLGHSADPSR